MQRYCLRCDGDRFKTKKSAISFFHEEAFDKTLLLIKFQGMATARHISPLTSTIGLKIIMALTGLGLLGFAFVHMAGNLTTLPFLGGGADALNNYAHKLQTLPLPILWGFRLALLVMVGVHIWAAIKLTAHNRAANPIAYAEKRANKATFASRSMIVSGTIVLSFIVFHLWHLTIKGQPFTHYEAMTTTISVGGEPHVVPDVYQRVITGFQNPYIAIFYVVAVGLLCLHLSHGVQSMFRTLGLANGHTIPLYNLLASAVAAVLFIGMASIPLLILLRIVQ
jgi:succinate dehydrogenase / fumarate reductase, cytochrome b subunit